jgi:serine/threonine-protein kinase
MASDRWRQVSELYNAARARTPEDRAAFLAAACGNDETLRREVETLLEQDAVTSELPSRQIASYHIVSLLGAGGMGAVYLADDTRLLRKVALKVLHPGDEDAKQRLLHEARAAAALDHPNICAVFEAGEAGGQSYIAMQFVEARRSRRVSSGGEWGCATRSPRPPRLPAPWWKRTSTASCTATSSRRIS